MIPFLEVTLSSAGTLSSDYTGAITNTLSVLNPALTGMFAKQLSVITLLIPALVILLVGRWIVNFFLGFFTPKG
jgi:hypothetical protein